jgi:hypothetical protein
MIKYPFFGLIRLMTRTLVMWPLENEGSLMKTNIDVKIDQEVEREEREKEDQGLEIDLEKGADLVIEDLITTLSHQEEMIIEATN